MYDQKLLDLKKLFSWALTWSALEALSYYTILTTHLVALFYTTDAIVYSTQGSLFALVYLFITLANGALELAIIPVFSLLNKTVEGKNYLIHKILIQTWILFLTPFAMGLVIKYFFATCVPLWAIDFLTYKCLLIFSLLVTSEGTKKNLRALLHLTLHYRALATLEFLNIISYVVLLWGLYFYGFTLSIPLLIGTFLSVSLITTLILFLIILFHYHTNIYKVLFKKTTNPEIPEYKIISSLFFTTRFYSFINQLMRIIFSGNFLLPFLTLKVGIAHAGLLALVNGITSTSASIIQRIFGSVGATLFAHTKNSDHHKQQVFQWLTSTSHTLSLIFLVIFIINIPHFIQLNAQELSTNTISLLILFFLVHIVESSFVIYEKLLIAHNQAYLLIYLNSAHGLFCLALSYFYWGTSTVLLFALCLISRLLFLTIFKKIYDRSH